MIAPDGYSGLRCNKCSRHFTMPQEKIFYGSSKGFICTCGIRHSYSTLTTSVSLLADSAVFVSTEGIEATVNATWYHVTTQKNWHQNLISYHVDGLPPYRSVVPMVHIGTLHAAMARVDAIQEREDRKNIYLHTMTLIGVVQGKIFKDDDMGPENVGEIGFMSKQGYGNINRYINEVESPGSVSLLVNPHSVKVTKTEKIFSF